MREELSKIVENSIKEKYLYQRVSIHLRPRRYIVLDNQGLNWVSSVNFEFAPRYTNGYKNEYGYKIELILLDWETREEPETFTLWSVENL